MAQLPVDFIDNLEDRVQKMIQAYENQQNIIQTLRKENVQLQRLVYNRETTNGRQVAKQIEAEQPAKATTSKGIATDDLEKQLNACIRDVDICIRYFEHAFANASKNTSL